MLTLQQKVCKLFCKPVSKVLIIRGLQVIKDIDVCPIVTRALENGDPVVALESGVVVRSLLYPNNMKKAIAVEEAVRAKGAVPATIALVRGRLKVGLDEKMLSELAIQWKKAPNISGMDFPNLVGKSIQYGGTTLSGTVILASMVGIQVIATGGLEARQRVGDRTSGVNADLIEFTRHPVIVVSSGVKCFFDIKYALEFMEMHGVSVATFGEFRNFPSFYAHPIPYHSVQHPSPYNVQSPVEAAVLFNNLVQLHQPTALILAVPLPEWSILRDTFEIETGYEDAIRAVQTDGVKFRRHSTFNLVRAKFFHAAGRRSSAANLDLLEYNAGMAAQVAVELTKLQKGEF